MTASVEISAICKTFDGVAALKDVSLDIDAGEYIVLLGPSGCGKTTLLSIIGGFLSPDQGRVKIGEEDVTEVNAASRPTTTMFQDYALFPHMNLEDNVSFGLRMRGVSRRDRLQRARTLLELVGLPGVSRRKPHDLSGGQRQRVALARALAVDPEVLLLDEPLGALDLKLRRQMQDELKQIQKRVGTTFIHVTHDQEEAMAIADRIVVMNQGRVEDFGTAGDIYANPGTKFCAGFMGEINWIEGIVESIDTSTCQLHTSVGRIELPRISIKDVEIGVGDAMVMGIRPEHFRAGVEESSSCPVTIGDGAVQSSSFFGTHHRCHVDVGGNDGTESLVVHLPPSVDRLPDLVSLVVDGGRVVVFKQSALDD